MIFNGKKQKQVKYFIFPISTKIIPRPLKNSLNPKIIAFSTNILSLKKNVRKLLNIYLTKNNIKIKNYEDKNYKFKLTKLN